jgi:hypothetical protein
MMTEHKSRETRSAYTIRYRWNLLPRERGVPACLSYIVEGDRIRLPGNPAGVKFDFPIGDIVETEDTIVICLQVPEGRKCSENVYAIDHSGNLRWRVAPRPFDIRYDSYVALSLHASVLNLHTRAGNIYQVNPESGSLLPEGP